MGDMVLYPREAVGKEGDFGAALPCLGSDPSPQSCDLGKSFPLSLCFSFLIYKMGTIKVPAS